MAVFVVRAAWPFRLALVLAITATSVAARADTASHMADGIAASLRVGQNGAQVGWHFVQRPPAPVERIAVTLNGRALGVPTAPLAPFPAPGQTAALLYLIDAGAMHGETSDAAALPRGVTMRSVRFGGEASDTVRDAWPLQLPEAIARGVSEMSAIQADRRAIVLFTDGLVGRPLPTDALVAQAKAAGVALVVALEQSGRLADVAGLTQLAEASGGGVVIPGRDLTTALLDGVLSGAEIRFTFGDARRFIWERRAVIAAKLDYGDRTLSLETDAELPAAGMSDTAALLVARARRRLPAFAGGVIATLIGVVALRRRHAPA